MENDLREDILYDPEFPQHATSKKEIWRYLETLNAVRGAFDALNTLWPKYKNNT